MDWVIWLVVAAIVILVGGAYLSGRTRAGQILATRSMQAVLSTDVREVMSAPPTVVREDTSVAQAAGIMLDGGIRSLPVVGAAGRLVGIVTESDLTGARPWLSLRSVAQSESDGSPLRGPDLEGISATPVGAVMTRRVVTAEPGDPIWVVADRMMERDIHHVPVVEGGIPVGVVARHDLLRVLAGRGPAAARGEPASSTGEG